MVTVVVLGDDIDAWPDVTFNPVESNLRGFLSLGMSKKRQDKNLNCIYL